MGKKINKSYCDGQFISDSQKLTDDLTPGVGYTKGVFESFIVSKNNTKELDAHWLRFQRGMRLYGLKLSYSLCELKTIIEKLLILNGFNLARVRLVSYTYDKQSKVAVQIFSFKRTSASVYKNGYSLKVSSYVRNVSYRSHIKSLDYNIFREALLDAKKDGYDEALLLNNEKFVVEGSTSNVFIGKKGELYTPRIRSGCLNGITRNKVIRSMKQLGCKVKIKDLSVKDVNMADFIFVTNSIIGVMPINRVNNRAFDVGNCYRLVKDLNVLIEHQFN